MLKTSFEVIAAAEKFVKDQSFCGTKNHEESMKYIDEIIEDYSKYRIKLESVPGSFSTALKERVARLKDGTEILNQLTKNSALAEDRKQKSERDRLVKEISTMAKTMQRIQVETEAKIKEIKKRLG